MMRFLRLLAWSVITAALVIAALGGAGYWLYREAEAAAGRGPHAGRAAAYRHLGNSFAAGR